MSVNLPFKAEGLKCPKCGTCVGEIKYSLDGEKLEEIIFVNHCPNPKCGYEIKD